MPESSAQQRSVEAKPFTLLSSQADVVITCGGHGSSPATRQMYVDLAREVKRLHQPDDALRLTVAQALHRDRGTIPTIPWDDLPFEPQWSGESQALYLAYADTALAALRSAPVMEARLPNLTCPYCGAKPGVPCDCEDDHA